MTPVWEEAADQARELLSSVMVVCIASMSSTRRQIPHTVSCMKLY